MKWSPQDAMKAYLHTLQLSKIQYGQDCTLGTTKLIQPQCMEFLSALAAGNQAKVMVQVLSNEGVNPLTIALAVAAKHCGGRFICFLDQQQDIEDCTAQLSCYDLEDVVEFMHGNPCEVIIQLKNIDFAVIDCKFKDHLRLFQIIDVNPRGSIAVVTNLVRKGNGAGFGEVVREKRGVECVTLSIGEGMELTRIGVTCNHENKRFYVTSEN
ncbi:uncharacterized protein LOC117907654 [Vitis riparia]|uniref:uncharacterized protein LOC117907654 n=1 Tax=Vitis riparia TaxID=96939 RepID=UPI00155A19A2|nr:uncharacterized protein LOC117907654 [Vitis riparia]